MTVETRLRLFTDGIYILVYHRCDSNRATENYGLWQQVQLEYVRGKTIIVFVES